MDILPVSDIISTIQLNFIVVIFFLAGISVFGFVFAYFSQKYKKVPFFLVKFDESGYNAYTREFRIIPIGGGEDAIITPMSLIEVILHGKNAYSIPLSKFSLITINGKKYYLGYAVKDTVFPAFIENEKVEKDIIPLGIAQPKIAPKDIGLIQDILRINLDAHRQVQAIVDANAPLLFQFSAIAGIVAVGFAVALPIVVYGMFAGEKINEGMKLQAEIQKSIASIPTQIHVVLNESRCTVMNVYNTTVCTPVNSSHVYTPLR